MLHELSVNELACIIPLMTNRAVEAGVLEIFSGEHAMAEIATSVEKGYGVVRVDNKTAPKAGYWAIHTPSIWFKYKACYIMGIMSDPEERSMENARELFSDAEHWAREKGCKELNYAAYLLEGPNISPLLRRLGMTERETQYYKPLN